MACANSIWNTYTYRKINPSILSRGRWALGRAGCEGMLLMIPEPCREFADLEQRGISIWPTIFPSFIAFWTHHSRPILWRMASVGCPFWFLRGSKLGCFVIRLLMILVAQSLVRADPGCRQLLKKKRFLLKQKQMSSRISLFATAHFFFFFGCCFFCVCSGCDVCMICVGLALALIFIDRGLLLSSSHQRKEQDIRNKYLTILYPSHSKRWTN